jgi:hypothetical protein
VLRTSHGYAPDLEQIATFPEVAIEVVTAKQELLSLSFIQGFVLEKKASNDWKVRTLSYMYSVDDSEGREILGFHWHPNASPLNPILYPHLHLGDGAGVRIREEIRAIHFRTDRMAFEDLGLMLIREFSVIPVRRDAIQVLTENLKQFRDRRSWSSIP